MKKPSLNKTDKRKAVKKSARSAADGATSRVREEPARIAAAVALCALLAAVAGWLLARNGSSGDGLEPQSPSPQGFPQP